MGRSGLVFVLFALLAGGAIGYVIGSGAGGQPPAEDPTEESAPPSPPPEEWEEPEKRVPVPSAADHASLESWIAAMPEPKVRTGDAVISGSVRTKDGKPLAGVTVRAYPQAPPTRAGSPPRRSGPPKDKDLTEIVLRTIERTRRGRAERRAVRTDADGSFEFTGLADMKHRLLAYAEGYRLEAPGVNAWQVAPGTTVEFVATPSIMTKIVVRLPDGTQPETASLAVDGGPDRRSGRSWRPDDDEKELAPGTWKISAKCGEHKEFWSEEVRFEVEAGRPPPTVELHCRAVRGIRGRVVFPEGEDEGHVRVAAIRLGPGTTADPARLTRADRTVDVWGGRDDGYTFLDLPAGTWLVGLLLDYRRTVAHDTVEVSEGLAVLDLSIPAPDPAEYVVVTVLGPDDEPVDKAYFNTEYQAGGGHSGGGSRILSLGDGRWRVNHHVKPDDYDEGGRYGIEVKVEEFGAKKVWYDRETTRELTVRFEAPATLIATVTGYSGSGMEGQLSLSLDPAGEDRPSHMESGRISPEGEQRFGPTPPGSYDLKLSVRRGEHNLVPVETVRVELKAGENRHTLLPPKLYTLTVLAENLPEGTRLRLRPKDRSGGWWGSDRKKPENGRVVFDRLPAGEYVVEADGRAQMMFVSVPGKAIVRFEASVINAMKVRITREDGGLAKAGLRDGDLIIGVGGEDFRDMAHMSALLSAEFSKESSKLIVLRGGRRVVLDVALGGLMKSGNSGGKMEPASR